MVWPVIVAAGAAVLGWKWMFPGMFDMNERSTGSRIADILQSQRLRYKPQRKLKNANRRLQKMNGRPLLTKIRIELHGRLQKMNGDHLLPTKLRMELHGRLQKMNGGHLLPTKIPIELHGIMTSFDIPNIFMMKESIQGFVLCWRKRSRPVRERG